MDEARSSHLFLGIPFYNSEQISLGGKSVTRERAIELIHELSVWQVVATNQTNDRPNGVTKECQRGLKMAMSTIFEELTGEKPTPEELENMDVS